MNTIENWTREYDDDIKETHSDTDKHDDVKTGRWSTDTAEIARDSSVSSDESPLASNWLEKHKQI